MFEKDEFYIDEAWIFFKLNLAPIYTEEGGDFNVLCLMDAASQFILATELMSAISPEPSELDSKRIFKNALMHNKKYPKKLIVSKTQQAEHVAKEAIKHRVAIVSASEDALMIFIKEARDGFLQHVSNVPRQ